MSHYNSVNKNTMLSLPAAHSMCQRHDTPAAGADQGRDTMGVPLLDHDRIQRGSNNRSTSHASRIQRVSSSTHGPVPWWRVASSYRHSVVL